MIFLQTKDHSHVFGCQACKDVNHKLSVRVMTDQFYKREVRRALAQSGGLLTGPPPIRQPQMYRQQPKGIEWDFSGKPKSSDGKYELVTYEKLADGNLQIQMAVGGKLCPQMDDHLDARKDYPTEVAYWTRVARASELMLHLYGDPRAPLTPEESAQREQQMY
jgi:hypothetical protein